MKIVAWPARKNFSRNPFQKLLYDSVEAVGGGEVLEFSRGSIFLRRRPDIFHVHWPDVFLASGKGFRFWIRYAFLFFYLFAFKLRGAKIVWTAHNYGRTGQSNSALLSKYFWPYFLNMVDGVIFMTSASERDLKKKNKAFENIPGVVIHHGHYGPIVSMASGDVDQAPNAPPKVIFFGSITVYKNAYQVLESFLQLPAGVARLDILGEVSARIPDKKLLSRMEHLPQDRVSEVRFENRFLPESELISAIRDADLVVFPYADVLNSGSAIFALSCGRPLLASSNDLFAELQGCVGPDWVSLIDGDLDGALLQDALSKARALLKDGKSPDLSAFEWDFIARQTVDFYTSLCAPKQIGT